MFLIISCAFSDTLPALAESQLLEGIKRRPPAPRRAEGSFPMTRNAHPSPPFWPLPPAVPVSPEGNVRAGKAEADTAPEHQPQTHRGMPAYLGQIHAKFELRNEMKNYTALILHDTQFCLFLIFSVAFFIFGQNQLRA